MMLKIVPTPEFSKQVKRLSRTYKRIGDDLLTLKNELISNPRSGIDLGYNCYKIRLANSSIPTGKSGGFRVITYYFDHNETIRLLFIYSKTQQDSVSTEEILDVLKRNNI